MSITSNKNYPLNEHHGSYSSVHGWDYLGSDDKFDFYVNHTNKWTSIVCSNEDSDYISAPYNHIVEGNDIKMLVGSYEGYPFNIFRELIAAKKVK